MLPESEQESDSQIWRIAGLGSGPESKILEQERSRSLKKDSGRICYKDKLWNHSCMDAINSPKRLIYSISL